MEKGTKTAGLKSEASPFRDIAVQLYEEYVHDETYRPLTLKETLERAIRLAVEATNQAVIKEWNQAMTSSAFDRRLHQLDYLEIAELMATLAEKERT